ncbi:Ankyrin repeat protein [Legionella wadsworthii]|uniref:Ankyrin repeat protein n=1 Tax=Legionella wadsworthii TaxID=28088 RepID=A0A378LMD1_9GAMM|nr:hypothetical protein [Legionella wadsworthii]STY27904.1 Ankyrin repeat protein [Legionella wadsworthii]
MISKEDLIRQRTEKQELLTHLSQTIRKERELLEELKQQKQMRVNLLGNSKQANKKIIERDIPRIFSLAQEIPGSSLGLDIDDKEAVLKYVQDQITALEEVQKKTKDLSDKTILENKLLLAVQSHLSAGYNQKTLADLANNSGITGYKSRGFPLLLDILGEKQSDYFLTFESTDRQNLTKAVSKKLESLAFPLSVDAQALSELASALGGLEEIKKTLMQNYEGKERVTEELHQIEQQITHKETITIRELARQEEDLQLEIDLINRQITELQVATRRLLAIDCIQLLNEYIIDRNSHYHTKDLLSSEDKETRNQFISSLNDENNGLFKVYMETGHSDDLIQKITTEIGKFPGIKMQATLNRVVVKLMDADDNEKLKSSDEEASRILLNFEEKGGRYKAFSEKIKGLSLKIAELKTFAATLSPVEKDIIEGLADSLQNDVALLICQNPEELPSKESYTHFEMKFKARLHSQDDLMSEHFSFGEIVANILFSLVTLGKLLYTKAKTGRASFFFDKTEAQKEMEAPVDNALEGLSSLFNENTI